MAADQCLNLAHRLWQSGAVGDIQQQRQKGLAELLADTHAVFFAAHRAYHPIAVLDQHSRAIQADARRGTGDQDEWFHECFSLYASGCGAMLR
ncbi:hypothetical protein D3C84_799190 [compost metagenome]